ncbi:MAG: leucine-rich repeat protein [Herbinix sp.]|jgi:internalin A|nr:leucine-rich repeat protein [Herbinix sp.]
MKYINIIKHKTSLRFATTSRSLLGWLICILITVSFQVEPGQVFAAADHTTETQLHAFYPSNAIFSDQLKRYIDEVDSLSFAWSRIDSEEPGIVNTTKDRNGNQSFYYPTNYLQPVEYAKSKGKSIQMNIYMDSKDCIELLPYEDMRSRILQAITDFVQTDITSGKGIYYDGVVIDFEGLRNTSDSSLLLYEGKQIGTYFIQFLTELQSQLTLLDKKLYVAVNPGQYYDGYDYASIMNIADRMILMAHDYEPTERLEKNQVQQYTEFDALEPINSMAPIGQIRQALNEIQSVVKDKMMLSKVWLQITFDSAQWQFGVSSAAEWESLKDNTLSREGRLTPLYKSIKMRVDNTDGKGQHMSYGYNNELQTPYIQYFNSFDPSWNVILYEDSNSIRAKVELAKAYGLGGISVWSLANVPDYTDAKGKEFHLDGWTTLLEQMATFEEPIIGGNEYIIFTDAYVEQAVREKLGKLSGKLTKADTVGIYRLKLSQGVKSLKDLKLLPNLEYLDAQQLGMKDISSLSSLTKLKVLYLQRNNITNIGSLKKLTKLELLSMNGNQLIGLDALSSLTKLRELYLRENKISDIKPLGKLTNLVTLEIGKNSIQKVDTIEKLKKLKLLALDNNRIVGIQALKTLTELEHLYLQRNTISDISVLSSMKQLRLISLNGNKISNVKALGKLTRLELLYLKDNKITDISSLKGLRSLKELYLGGNLINDYSPVNKLLQKSEFKCDFNFK